MHRFAVTPVTAIIPAVAIKQCAEIRVVMVFVMQKEQAVVIKQCVDKG